MKRMIIIFHNRIHPVYFIIMKMAMILIIYDDDADDDDGVSVGKVIGIR